jgi:hypothetical protein
MGNRRTSPFPPSLKRLLTVFFLVTVGGGTVIAAEPPSPEEQAAAHLEAGNQRLEASDFSGAAAEYRAGFAIYPRANLLFNIGLAELGQEHFIEAAAAFDGVLARPETTPEVAAQAREQLAGLHEKLAVVAVRGNEGATLVVDNQPRGTLPLRQSLRLMPGVHTLRATRDGYRLVEREISGVPGSRVDVDLTLEPLPPPPKPRRRYWLWATVAAAVAAAAVIGFAATRGGEPAFPPCPPEQTPCLDIRH